MKTMDLTWLKDRTERYLYFSIESDLDHSFGFEFDVYSSREDGIIFDMRTGVLGRIKTMVCFDLTLLDAHALFPETCPGQLKITCHGRRVDREEIRKIVIRPLVEEDGDRTVFGEMTLSDVYPENLIFADGRHLPEGKVVDEMGQNKQKDWEGKQHSLSEMIDVLQKQKKESDGAFPYEDWSVWGGWKKKKLSEGTGFFSKCRENGRWWLTDPEGNAFFSVGPDCVVARSDCRVDGVEKWMDWLPSKSDPVYGPMYEFHENWPAVGEKRRKCTLFSFEQANLYRAFGEGWYEDWKNMITGQLRKFGMNTLGNWSDPKLFGKTGIAYVTSLPEFPKTKQSIFRDFPDVFDEEYREDAARCAKALEKRKDDPWMIGYFLRNEPAWAFVDNLILADEVLYNPARSTCRERLIGDLKEKYKTVDALNAAWNRSFASFDDLYESQKKASESSPAAKKDLKEFSVKMLDAYIRIPSEACRKEDPNHMILGMRWAWISDPDVVTGWENFDVFSINCYAVDPTKAIDRVVELGVDLPVMIGEFHFGALDAGPCSTGLEGVKDQKERGKAYQYYAEHAAAHPYGVGCHYFQCYDQFVLGRFDGENYNIGLFDICSVPYAQMMNAVKDCSGRIYRIAAGEEAPTKEKPQEVPMIAF